MIRKGLPLLLTSLMLIITSAVYAQQNVGIGTNTPNNSAILDLTATNKGLLIPRMTSIQRTAIVTPATGLLVFDTDFDQFWYFDGTQWIPLTVGTGPAGPNGPTGASGIAGPTGSMGPTGSPGTPGTIGPTGPTGTNGTAGAQGPTGPTGINGTAGAQGPTGPSGANGSTGAQGPTGQQGTTGAPGPVGCGSSNYIIKSNGALATCSQIFDNGTYVWLNPTAPATGSPFTRLQIGETYGYTYSSWPANLRQGILIGAQTDDLFLGVEDNGSDDGRAVILWGDNPCDIPDNALRFMVHNSDFTTFSEKVRITGCGNFGIGNSSPAYRLDVTGDINLTGALRISGNPGTAGQVLTSNGAGAPSWASSGAGSGITGVGTMTANYITKWITPGVTGTVANSLIYDDGTNVGIGTATPSNLLEIYGSGSNNSAISMRGNANTYPCMWMFNFGHNNNGLLFDAYYVMGTGWISSSNTANFAIYNNPTGMLQFNYATGVAPGSTITAGNMNNAMSITTGGRVGVGTTTPGGQFELSLDQGRKPSTTTWTITSDERLKTIEGPYTKGLKEILLLQPITFHYKNAGERKFSDEVLNTLCVGFSAQNVQKVFPEAVGVDEDGYLNFNMHSILVAYVNAIKEQQVMIDSLKWENQNQQSAVGNLKSENQELKAQLGTLSTEIEKIKQQLELDAKK
jgi:hypothetical protein